MNRTDYDFNDFADDGALRVPVALILMVLYLSRHVLVFVLGGFSTFVASKQGIDSSGFSSLYSGPVFVIASVPALAVLVAMVLRRPAVGAAPRVLWRAGRWLLIVAALLDLALVVSQIATTRAQVDVAVIVFCMLDGYALYYLLRSARVRDTFADFPEPIAVAPEDEPIRPKAREPDDDELPVLPSLSSGVSVKFGSKDPERER